MAHKSSGALSPDMPYLLGEYELDISKVYDSSRNATVITARCGDIGAQVKPSGHKIVAGDARLIDWSVEANDETADVYATILKESRIIAVELSVLQRDGIAYYFYGSPGSENRICMYSWFGDQDLSDAKLYLTRYNGFLYGGVITERYYDYPEWGFGINSWGMSIEAKKFGTLGWYYDKYPFVASICPESPVNPSGTFCRSANIVNQKTTFLVTRFAIDLSEAGGTGTGSTWYDPGDWNSNPSTVLNLTVNGALSGRHNDPLNQNADYSYVPADQNKTAGYGCGGHGGHGGGGGAGASTIVVNKFTTDKANSKNIVTKPKRHGYGSGGGKGGKGGDGLILIYY